MTSGPGELGGGKLSGLEGLGVDVVVDDLPLADPGARHSRVELRVHLLNNINNKY